MTQPQTGRSLGFKMLGMNVGDAALAGYITLVSGALGALLWTRLNRIEAELATRAGTAELEIIRQELAGKSDKNDLQALRQGIAGLVDKADIEAIRKELAAIRQDLAGKADKADVEAIRREMALMRSDITQVALRSVPDGPRPRRANPWIRR